MLWFHSIDLGMGVTTRGLSELTLGVDQLPDVRGRSVLDIGAWDGYYSFFAEQHGATRVVALDHYATGVDFAARQAYWAECAQQGVLPDHNRDVTDFWRPELPGRRGFEFAHGVLGSSVEPLVADFTTVDLEALGPFDVVFYLGVLYHMKEPLTCLERVRKVTTEVAVVETEPSTSRATTASPCSPSTAAATSRPTTATGTSRPSRPSSHCAWPPGSPK